MANVLFKRLLLMAVLLVPASVLSGTVLFFTGSRFTEAILLVTDRIISILHPEYQFKEFKLLKQVRPRRINFFIFVPNPGNGIFFNDIEGFPFSIKLFESTLYIMPIITFSLILAWPFLRVYKRLAAIFISIPFLLSAELLDISVYIMGNIGDHLRSNVFVANKDNFKVKKNNFVMKKDNFAMGIEKYAVGLENSAVDIDKNAVGIDKNAVGSVSFSYHVSMFFASFLGNGGRQFIALLIFLIAIAPFHMKTLKWKSKKVKKE